MYCTQCGTQNPDGANFCSACGRQMLTDEQNQQPTHFQTPLHPQVPVTQDNLIDSLYSAYVGRKYYDFYRVKWFGRRQAVINPTKKGFEIYSFNLAGLLLGVGWMFYRKMYGYASLVILMTTVLDLAFMYTKGVNGYSSFNSLSVNLISLMVTGFMGNFLYLTHCSKKIGDLRSLSSNTEELKYHLTRQGGTSWLSAIFGILAMVALNILLYMFLAPEWVFQ